MMTTLFIALGTLALPASLFLITISLVSDKAPVSLYVCGIGLAVIGFIFLILSFVRAYREDEEKRTNNVAIRDAYALMHRDVNELVNELRQDRRERKKSGH